MGGGYLQHSEPQTLGPLAGRLEQGLKPPAIRSRGRSGIPVPVGKLRVQYSCMGVRNGNGG